MGKSVEVKHSPLNIFIRILIFIILVVGTTIFARPLQITLQNRMEKIRENFIGQAEDFFGLRILYGSMGPSIFGILDIRNVVILREDDSVLLNISRVRLSYSFAALISGRSFDAFRSIRIDRPVLSFDFDKDADLIERIGSLNNANNNSSQIYSEDDENGLSIPDNLSIRVWNGEWELSDPYGSLKILGVGLDASVKQGRIIFQGR